VCVCMNIYGVQEGACGCGKREQSDGVWSACMRF
jgi:hypothetical protein